MQIFSPDLVGQVSHKKSDGLPPDTVEMHSHQNKDVVDQFAIDEHGNLLFKGAQVGGSLSNADVLVRFSLDSGGALLFDSEPVDTVGQQFVNSAILEKFSVVDGKLLFDGSPVDTVGSVFTNDAVLRMFSQDADGGLLFNGKPIEAGGANLPNADDLARLAVDENGQLTVDGAVVSGSGGAITLTCTQAGSGVQLAKGFLGTDLALRTLKAGANVTLNVTSDEIEINSSLSGSVSAASTFTRSDDYTRSQQVLSLPAYTKLRAIEPSTADAGLVFQATLCDDTNSSINGAALTSKGTAPVIVDAPMFRNERALKCSGGCLVVPEGTSASVTAPSTWFSGTKDWCIELEFSRDTSKLGTIQNLVSNYTDRYANASLWIGIGTDNKPYVGIGYGSSVSETIALTSSVTVTDGNKHHLAVVRQGSTYTLYVDGVSRATATSTQSNNAPAHGFYLGSSVASGASATPFYGYLRAVRVWNFAKYTAAFTVPALSYPITGDAHLDMAGKLLSASFWKQVTSLTVVSTETATAYLKWLMVDTTGYWVWDSANSVWITADVANITSVGMTTAEVKAAFANNPWNYRSDSVGFAVALVTTDGASTPVLTSVTLAAVQSADKTSGHTVLDELGSALPQRAQLQFKGMVVTDNGVSTVVQGHGEEVGVLQAQVVTLQQQSGKVAGYTVSVESPVNGSVLTYDSESSSFVAAVAAEGASGNGLHMTDVVVLAAGAEALVTHQRVSQGRAIYQAEEFIPAGDAVNERDVGFSVGLVSAAPIQGQSVRAQRQGYRLPFQYNSIVKNAMKTLPQHTFYPVVFQVDDLVYITAGRVSSTTATTAIQTAPHDDPTTVTKIAATTDVACTYVNSCVDVLRFGDYLYRIGEEVYPAGSSQTNPTIKRAHISDPTSWTAIGEMAIPLYWSTRFVVGQYLYYVGGVVISADTYRTANIYRSPLSDLTQMEQVGTFAGSYLYAPTFYQYGDYLYIIGGRTGSSASSITTLTNKIWRAHVSDPTQWTQIGTFPVALAYTGCGVVGDRVIIGGVRTGSDGSTYSASAWMAPANNPTSWATITALNAAIAGRGVIVVDDTYCLYGGANASSSGSTQIDSYTLTFTNTADRAIVYTEDYSLDPIQTITSLELDASIPAGTSIRAMLSFDKGATWCYWNGSVWIAAPLEDASFDAGVDAVASGSRFKLPGIEGVFDRTTVRFAFQMKSTVATTTPRIYGVRLNYVEAGSMQPLDVGGFDSLMAAVGIKHRQGTYQATSVKNLTNRSLSLVLKVYDGALS